MMHLGTFLLCLAAFACLAMAMDRHQENVLGRALSSRAATTWRVAGWALLITALVVVVQGQGWSLGLVSYSGHTSLSAGIVFVALVTWSRRHPASG